MASSLRTELPPPYAAPAAPLSSVGDAGAHPAPATILRSRHDEPTGRWAGFAIVVGVHLVALYALLQYEPARQALTSIAPIMVDLITPPKLEVPPPPPPPPPPPRPQPRPKLEPLKTAEPPPIIAAAPTIAPADFVAPPPAPPAPPVEVAATAAPVMTAPTAAPAPVTPPSFDAAYLKNDPPRYPNASRRMSETGRVLLRVLVSAAGAPEKVELATSSGFERLDASAIDTVRTWKFVPAHQAGKPVAAWVQVPITFSLAR